MTERTNLDVIDADAHVIEQSTHGTTSRRLNGSFGHGYSHRLTNRVGNTG